jgi:hypothetical protein
MTTPRTLARRLLPAALALACAACGLDRAGLEPVDGAAVSTGAGGSRGGAGGGNADAPPMPDAAAGDSGGLDGAGAGAGDGDGPSADAAGEAGSDAPMISPVGCADGTREGYVNVGGYPLIAACSGGWQVAGLLATGSYTPQCARQGGNDGPHPAGAGCSVADLCAEGWHVCLTAHEVFQNAGDCKDAVGPAGATKMFFVTRQRALGNTCPAANDVGTNHLHGCGNFGSPEDKSCTPFPVLLKDTDCTANTPWLCPVTTSGTTTHNEYETVTKPGSGHGGVLCCHD